MHRIAVIIASCALVCACSSNTLTQSFAGDEPRQDGAELFYSDSLNACFVYRTYPVPEGAYTPPPKGYKPVYISTYARHGSRKLHRGDYSADLCSVLAGAHSAGALTPLGEEVLAKAEAMDADLQGSVGDLTSAGVEQHKGVARRMYRNYRNVFRSGAPIRLYSTVVQRTMMSMFACNEELKVLNPKLDVTRQSSEALTYLTGPVDDPYKDNPHKPADDFIRDELDFGPVLGRIFTEGAPALEDTAVFVRNLYVCGAIAPGLDVDGVGYLWDVFSADELFTLQQALNYMMYVRTSNSPELGDLTLSAMKPLLGDFVDKADEALSRDVPGADLRFGHDTYLVPFLALVGVGGHVAREEDPLKVIDTFQDFTSAPMAGNFQMVFCRNRSGDVIVKVLRNEVETWIPVDTDIYPYYRWEDVRAYFNALIES